MNWTVKRDESFGAHNDSPRIYDKNCVLKIYIYIYISERKDFYRSRTRPLIFTFQILEIYYPMRIVKSAGMDGLEFERNVVKNKKEKSWETMIEKFSRFYLYRLEFFPSISSETRNNTTIVMIFFPPGSKIVSLNSLWRKYGEGGEGAITRAIEEGVHARYPVLRQSSRSEPWRQ